MTHCVNRYESRPLITIWGKSFTYVQESNGPNTDLNVTPQAILSGSEKRYVSTTTHPAAITLIKAVAYGKGLLITKFSCQLIKHFIQEIQIISEMSIGGTTYLTVRRHFWITLIILQHRLHFTRHFLNLCWPLAPPSSVL